jgi:hypothetical protein
MRGVVVEARRDPPRRRPGEEPRPPQWVTVGQGCLYRYDADGRRLESLRLDVVGRERHLRLRIGNADDRPLAIRSVKVIAPVERLLFEAAAGESYRLTYGDAKLGPPSFDLARTMGDPEAWGASARSAKLGPPRRLSSPPGVPWTEAHPALLWAGLLAAVLALGGLTWRALGSSSS